MKKYKHISMKLIVITILGLFAFCANAELFKWKDAEGNVIFSDQPPTEIEKVESEVTKEELPQNINIVPAPEIIEYRSDNVQESVDDEIIYKSLAIISPQHETEVRENSGKVFISVHVDPDNFAERGHKLIIHMDDVEVFKGEISSVLLDNVDRGTHEIKASIVDNQGSVLKETRVTTFTLHRFHI